MSTLRAAATLLLILGNPWPVAGQDRDPDRVTPPVAAGLAAADQAGELKTDTAPAEASDAEDGNAEESKPAVGRLLIVSDAEVTIVVDGESIGTLAAGATLEHLTRSFEGEVEATSTEVATAKLERSYNFERPEENGTAEDSPDRSAPEKDAVAEGAVREDAAGDTPPSATADAAGLPTVEIKFRMAKAVREVRRSERQDKIYPDFEAGVMWAREDNRRHVTWRDAGDYCDNLTLGGYPDWRLPDIEELAGLQAMWSRSEYKTADPIRLSECCPWSSTEIDELHAWNFNFRFRRRFDGRKGHSYGMRALCIRDITAEELAEHEAALAERERKKKEDKKRKKLEKKGLLDEESEGESETALSPGPDKPPGR